MKNKSSIMHKLLNALIIISLVMPINIAAGAGGVDIAKEEAALLDREKLKQLIQSMRDGNYTHTGGAEAINLLSNKALLKNPSIKEGNSLEIGCGTGAASDFMSKKGYHNIWAIDINKKLIEEAKSSYPNVNFKVADVTKLTKTFEDEFFSFMFSFNVAHAVKDKVAMLQRLKAISKEGAILAIFDYYQKDETTQELFKNLSGKQMFPIKLSNFKIMMKILGWEIIEETDITRKYKFWYNAMIDKIEAKADMLKANEYNEKETSLSIEKTQYVLDSIESDKLGGIILIAKKI